MSAAPVASSYWAPRAWIGGRWAERVLLHAGADGLWAAIEVGVEAPPQSNVLPGPVLPGLVDAHCHAFQRAFAGLAERRALGHDDFWSWRDRMYRLALGITPAVQEAVAAQLFIELLQGGYTHVCEFHYLHRDPQGAEVPAAERATQGLADAIVRAAQTVGMGITLLPAVYECAGLGGISLRDDQRRFRAEAAWVARERAHWRAVFGPGNALCVAGAALHSLRAATPASIEQLARDGDDAPLHIHAAEQLGEVDECLAHTGRRPIEWLAHEGLLAPRWQLVHATHAGADEIAAVAASGAGVVLCPSTEANLGDGIPDLPRWLAAGVPISIGTDSNVCRAAAEEIRLIETVQRLALRQRCIAAAPERGEPSTAHRLWQAVLAGGGRAAGLARWGMEVGARADLLVLDAGAPALCGVAEDYLLDALVFSSPGPLWRDVMVAGRWVVRNGVHAAADEVRARFAQVRRGAS